MTHSTCRPQPAQVTLPQRPQRTALHMLVYLLKRRRTTETIYPRGYVFEPPNA